VIVLLIVGACKRPDLSADHRGTASDTPILRPISLNCTPDLFSNLPYQRGSDPSFTFIGSVSRNLHLINLYYYIHVYARRSPLLKLALIGISCPTCDDVAYKHQWRWCA